MTSTSEIQQQALEYLREVIDPEIGLNIVDLGLVYEIKLYQPGNTIQVTMTLTTQFCPMGASIVGGVEDTLRINLHDYSVKVNVVFDPRWNATMISEAGKKFLDD